MPTPEYGRAEAISFDGEMVELVADFSQFRRRPPHIEVKVYSDPVPDRDALRSQLSDLFDTIRQQEAALGGSGLDVETTQTLDRAVRFRLLPTSADGASERMTRLYVSMTSDNGPTDVKRAIARVPHKLVWSLFAA